MSSDDPRGAGLLADYNLPWGKVFRKLIQFLLSDQVLVDTWDECAVIAVIQGKGHICGKVSAVDSDHTRGYMQTITIAWKNALGHFGTKSKEVSRHSLRASAQPIRVGDAVCLSRGATRPTILRFYNTYSAIIMITAPLAETDEGTDEGADQEWSEFLRSIPTSPTDFVIVWDWDASPDELQDRDYESFISNRKAARQHWTESQDYFVRATRFWSFGMLLNGLERYEDAAIRLQKAVEEYVTALRSAGNSPGHGVWIDADEEALMAMNDLVIDDKGALVEVKSFTNHAPLFWAAEKGHEGLVKLLLDKGAAIDVETSTGHTPLFCAAENGHRNIVKLLLDKGATIIDSIARTGQTKLEWAVEQGHEGAVRRLLYNSINLNTQRNRYGNALWIASRGGHAKIVQTFLENGTGLNSSTRCNALCAAALQGHDTAVRMLLDKSANVNTSQGGYFGTALQAASFAGHDGIVQMLLEKGANMNARGARYGNALCAAALQGHDTTVQMLLDKGADVNSQGGYFGTALQAASFAGHDGIVQILFEKGANANAQGGGYGNALRAASWKDYSKIVQILIENGAKWLDR